MLLRTSSLFFVFIFSIFARSWSLNMKFKARFPSNGFFIFSWSSWLDFFSSSSFNYYSFKRLTYSSYGLAQRLFYPSLTISIHSIGSNLNICSSKSFSRIKADLAFTYKRFLLTCIKLLWRSIRSVIYFSWIFRVWRSSKRASLSKLLWACWSSACYWMNYRNISLALTP